MEISLKKLEVKGQFRRLESPPSTKGHSSLEKDSRHEHKPFGKSKVPSTNCCSSGVVLQLYESKCEVLKVKDFFLFPNNDLFYHGVGGGLY